MQKNYGKISLTSVFCARMRKKQGIPFSRELIELIDTKYKENIEDLPDYGKSLNEVSDFIPFIEGRYYSINKALEPLKNVMIIEIAAGLSPRSLNFLKREDVIYVETELPELIKIKEKIIKDIIKNKKLMAKMNIRFLSLNPLNKKEIDKIGETYKKVGTGKRMVIIHEGLLMYFTREEKRKFRDNIKYLFENYAKDGLWITTDLSRLKK